MYMTAAAITGTCRQRGLPPDNAALRLIRTHPVYHFTDGLRGDVFTDNATAEEDIIIFRKDKLFAYNLVVVLDDDYQGVTEVVRGADLLYPTSHQLSLYRQLRLPEPHYLHLPLMLGPAARKLSSKIMPPRCRSVIRARCYGRRCRYSGSRCRKRIRCRFP